MEIPINAKVFCDEEVCGRSTFIVLDPVKEEVTHFVVEETTLPNIERLVPIELIERSSHDEIHLRCPRDEYERMESFIETDFFKSDEIEYSVPFEYSYAVPYLIWPFVELPNGVTIVKTEHIPPAELAVRRGAIVEATDGQVGEVDEFVVEPSSGDITHLVLRKGLLWAAKDITIPVSQIDHIDENVVYLKIDKASVAVLPAIPIKQHRSSQPNKS